MDTGEYEIAFFKENEFSRNQCERCGSYFWTRDPDRTTCGDAPCEPYSFIGKPLFKEEKSPEEVRELFLSFFEHRSHTRLKRYPVVARWRDDIYLNIASISNFQPFVTSGKVPPPANPLVISQPCIRLEDLESIGKSGRHLTAFEMMGHHAFNTRGGKELYWKNETVTYCDEFLRQFGVRGEAVVYKEAPWMGGGNAGPCLEVILGGLELATLVFMDLERAPSGEIILKGERYRKMDTYIVDTGYGLERFVWASKGTPTVYDAIFPSVIRELLRAAGMEHPMERYPDIVRVHAQLAGSLKKNEIAQRLNISLEELKQLLEPVETIYALADHTKCLAFMLADGIVPSNAKEGYLARLVLRRAFRMLKSLGIELPLEELILLQIKNLKNSFPELEHAVDRIVEIVSLEKRRYEETLVKGERIIQQEVKRWSEAQPSPKSITINTDRLIYYYDTHGLPPEFVQEVVAAMRRDVKGSVEVNLEIPDNFYSLVARAHSEERKEEEEGAPIDELLKEKLKGMPPTRKLYYEEPNAVAFEAKVLGSVNGSVILDQTLFYPEGGGQPADTGFLSIGKDEQNAPRLNVVDVREVEGVILHKVEDGAELPIGAVISGQIDSARRMAHKRHHSATHIVIHAARKVLGDHVWQAGAQKGEKRARLDITHFKRISDAERRAIELLANRMVMENKEIKATFMDRNEAEQKYGFRIYQGGVPVGKQIRIVRTGADEDVQACAGTHLSRTGEVGPIKIVRTERIQDGIERIEFAAGEAAVEEIQAQEELIRKSASVLKVPPETLPSVVERFFEEWKQLRKENERLRSLIADLELERLKREAEEIGDARVIAAVLPDADVKALLKIASQLASDNYMTLLIGKSEGHAAAVSAVPTQFRGMIHAGEVIKRVCEVLGGSGGGKDELAQGGGTHVEMVEGAREEGLRLIRAALTKK